MSQKICGFSGCHSPVEDEMEFCPQCGVPLSEKCPFCSKPVFGRKNRVFSCPHCRKSVQYCSCCGRLYPLGQVYCENNYCPNHIDKIILNKGLTFWQTFRGDHRYSGKVTFPEESPIEINENSLRIPVETDHSYLLIFGEKLLWYSGGRLFLFDYETDNEPIDLLLNPGVTRGYTTVYPVIISGKILTNEGSNIKIVDIHSLDSGKLLSSNLSSPIISPIGINSSENMAAFFTENGEFFLCGISGMGGEIKCRRIPESPDNEENPAYLPPLFINKEVFIYTRKGVIWKGNIDKSDISLFGRGSSGIFRQWILTDIHIIAATKSKLIFYNTGIEKQIGEHEINSTNNILSYPLSVIGDDIYYSDSKEIKKFTTKAPKVAPYTVWKAEDYGKKEIITSPIIVCIENPGVKKIMLLFSVLDDDDHYEILGYCVSGGKHRENRNVFSLTLDGKPEDNIAFFNGKIFVVIEEPGGEKSIRNFALS